MKKLSLVLTLLVGVSMLAQPGIKKQERPEFTPQQHAELRTKQFALALDLNEKQIAEIKKMELKRAEEFEKFKAERKDLKEGQKPDTQKIFEQKNARLDKELQHQADMKKILTPEQFEKWQKIREDVMRDHKGKAKNCDNPHPKGEKFPPKPIEEK